MAQGRASALTDLHGLSPAGGSNDETLTLRAVARAKEGDRHAIRYLYSRYSDAVRRYSISLLRDPDAADDVVQTTFLKLLTKIDRYEPRDVPFEAWLLRVARNVALDEMRRRKAAPSTEVLDHDAALEDMGTERLGTLRAALAKIPPNQREVLVLRHLVGLSSAEIADRLETTEAAVRTLHQRARTNLKLALHMTGGPQLQPLGNAWIGEDLRRMRFARRRPVVEVVA